MTFVHQFSPDDRVQIVAVTFIQHLDYHRQIGSTNDRAMELAKQPNESFPLLVLAESQRTGRGRGTNVWWSSGGALTFSVVLATEAAQLPPERWPQVSLIVGLAVCEALQELLSRGVPTTSLDALPAAQVKWPNDVYIEGRKICGILVEVPPNLPGKLILGIGINVNNSVDDAPEEIQQLATSLRDLTGQHYSLTDVLVKVLQQLGERLQTHALWTKEVVSGWRERCFLTGKSIQVDNGTRHSTGKCLGIDETGALLLDVDGQIEKHLAGVITVR